MKKYDEVRAQLIEMLEDLNRRLAIITSDAKHAEKHLEDDLAEQVKQPENNGRQL
ncbi:MAG: hypothetical protein PHY16_09710 [Methylobacter sp.]|nr:hypothetical protein [Methylobacter sp.]